MSLRLEMLQVARLAPRLLGDSTALVEQFLRSQLHPAGGFRNRAGECDLYYTVFGLEGFLALQADIPAAATAATLRRFAAGEGLDFIHLACLARCWADLPPGRREEAPLAGMMSRLEAFRSADGGYHVEPGRERGTIYACFLALGAYQDLGATAPGVERIHDCVRGLRTADGGYTNKPDLPTGSVPATAAAATLLRQLGGAPDPALAEWLLGCRLPDGGFFAAPEAPVPDLLSTATALHALAGLGAPLDAIREPCLDFLDSLWSSQGGFYGSWADDALDVEYTYYGLLALGHLAVW